jgi:hypothetical protein
VIQALCHTPEDRGFQIRLDNWAYSIYLILPAALVPGVYSAYNRNEFQKHKTLAYGFRFQHRKPRRLENESPADDSEHTLVRAEYGCPKLKKKSAATASTPNQTA